MKTPRALAAIALACAACHAPHEPRRDQGVQPAARSTPKETAPLAHPGVQPDPSARGTRAAKIDPASLTFEAQPGWNAVPTSSAMRKAQFALPHAEGDMEDASLVLYYFGNDGGGSKEANLERWAGQFEQPDGGESEERMDSSTRKVAGLDVLDVDLSGTYVAETAPGSGERVHKEGWRMLASIIDTPQGAYYAKLVGPKATIERWASSYRAYVSSAKLAP